MNSLNSASKPIALLGLSGTVIGAGAIIGASTNAVNGAVSPHYFRTVMRWQDVENVWRASIAQGIFEGLIYGVVLSVVFTMVVGIVSRSRCPYGFAFRHLLGMVVGVYGAWIVGGLIAMALAALSPEFFTRTFRGVPEEFGAMLRYAFVGGSIQGAMAGGVLSVAIGSVLFAARWRKRQQGD